MCVHGAMTRARLSDGEICEMAGVRWRHHSYGGDFLRVRTNLRCCPSGPVMGVDMSVLAFERSAGWYVCLQRAAGVQREWRRVRAGVCVTWGDLRLWRGVFGVGVTWGCRIHLEQALGRQHTCTSTRRPHGVLNDSVWLLGKLRVGSTIVLAVAVRLGTQVLAAIIDVRECCQIASIRVAWGTKPSVRQHSLKRDGLLQRTRGGVVVLSGRNTLSLQVSVIGENFAASAIIYQNGCNIDQS
ncbi:hypothetical protein BU15DRAFT_68119 [Melanogaster broomeanus]|nr:hypothetical protein BU15DRAFT_68119 [Melanogaster broomeanus]